MKKARIVSVLICMSVIIVSRSMADIIYEENFEVGTPPATDFAVSNANWISVGSTGVKLTALTADPSRIVNNSQLEGNYRTFMGSGTTYSQWLTSDEPDFNMAKWTDLKVSWLHLDTVDSTADGYRIGFKTVDGTWYLQDSIIQGNGVTTTTIQDIASLNFIVWTNAPADDSSSWAVPPTGGGSPMPMGFIKGIGLMLVKNGTGDKFRFDDIKITGSSVSNMISYTEDFELGDKLGLNFPVSDAGWKNVRSDGTSLTDATGDSRVTGNALLQGKYRTYNGVASSLSQWLTTDELIIDQNIVLPETISLMHYDNLGSSNANDGYRFGFLIGGSWYLQDTVIALHSGTITNTLDVESTGFKEWTSAPADDSSSWSVPSLGGGAKLPRGKITGLGLMLVKNESSDIFRFDNIKITTIPTPPRGTVIIIK